MTFPYSRVLLWVEKPLACERQRKQSRWLDAAEGMVVEVRTVVRCNRRDCSCNGGDVSGLVGRLLPHLLMVVQRLGVGWAAMPSSLGARVALVCGGGFLGLFSTAPFPSLSSDRLFTHPLFIFLSASYTLSLFNLFARLLQDTCLTPLAVLDAPFWLTSPSTVIPSILPPRFHPTFTNQVLPDTTTTTTFDNLSNKLNVPSRLLHRPRHLHAPFWIFFTVFFQLFTSGFNVSDRRRI
jgi:hypothetical protein